MLSKNYLNKNSKQKGFTLVELLAVIIILAIIALIAVPVIFNIIKTSKTRANQESVRNYIRAVDNSILLNDASDSSINIPDKTYQIMNTGNICIGTLNGTTCTGSILVVTVDGKKPKSGSITIQNGKVISASNLDFGSFTANMSNGNITVSDQDSDTSINVKIGDKVTFGSESFYVIEIGDSTVSLIAENNITLSTTSPRQSVNSGYIQFQGYTETNTSYTCATEGNDVEFTCYDLEYTNSNLYKYLKAYETYLKTTLNVSSASASLLTYQQLLATNGCRSFVSTIDSVTEIPCYGHSYIKGPMWLATGKYTYEGIISIVYYNINSSLFSKPGTEYSGIRPVITISISDLPS